MDNNFPVRHVTLGVSAKLLVFKLFDTLLDNEKNLINKDFWSKSSSKSNIYDAMEHLKSKSVKPKELKDVDKQCLTANMETLATDDNKKIPKKCKQKLLSLTDLCKDAKYEPVKYLTCVQPNAIVKSKSNLPMWFKKRKSYQMVVKSDICSMTISKQIKLELSIETEVVYVSPSLFFQSNKTLTIDSKNMIFYLFVQNRWNEIELGIQFVKNVTVFKDQSFIKFAIKPLILSDLQHVSDELGSRSLLPIMLHPKKVSIFKDVMIIFTKTPISITDISTLKSIFSEEKVLVSNAEKDYQELLTNLFNSAPKIRENLSNFSINWSLLSKMSSHSETSSSNITKSPLVASKKSPIPPCKPTGGLVKMVTPPLNQVPNLVLHQSPQVAVSMTNNHCNNKPIVNTVICHQNTANFMGNHIVIATPLATNRIDPYPNLFNRMINDSSSIGGQLTVMSCQVPQNQNFAFALTTPQNNNNNNNVNCSNNNNNINNSNNNNNNGLQINNFSAIYQRQTNHNQSMDMIHNGGTGSNSNNITNNTNHTIDRLSTIPTHLFYVPGRHIGNIFQSFNYAPSPDYNVLIHGSDLTCLNYGQYLNDNIINFYLNYIRYEKCSEEQRQRSHLFNVFFNTKLQGSLTSLMTDTPETRHGRVAKWTKKVDIFDKDFIIIPINEAQHWFLAIVCFPWMAGMISYDSLFGSHNLQQPSEIPLNHSEFAIVNRVERVRKLQIEKKIDPKPCILLFDSLQHQSRAPNVKLIREYLKSEWDAKRLNKDGPLVFDKNTIRGFNPQVPQQSNTIDCGIYVLHYVEMFFQHPLSLYTKEYFQSSLAEWFDKKTVEMKREFIQKLLLKKGEAQQNHSDNNSNKSETFLSPKISSDDSGPDIQIL